MIPSNDTSVYALFNNLLVKSLVACLRLYQLFISPLYVFICGTHNVCRFQPSCSEYAKLALERHGFFRGSCLALRRLLRCHPFSQRVVDDPVPPNTFF